MTEPTGNRGIETRLIAALTDTAQRNLADATPVPPLRPSNLPARPTGRVRAWTVPVLVAVVVVALTVGAVAVLRGGQQHAAPPAGATPGVFVTLRSHTGGLSAAELDKARQIISARAAARGAANAELRVVGPDEITAFLPGLTAADVSDLGAADVMQFRALIVSPVPLASRSPGPAAPSHAPQPVDPWKSLGFAPPTDAAAYDALSTSQRSAVQAVVNKWDCTNLPLDRASSPILACDRDGTSKYLLGPAIISGGDVRSAQVGAPTGSVGWQVYVDFTAAGQQRWTGYTTQHNESEQPGAMANQVATTLNGVVIVASTVLSTITGTTSIAGGFDQRSATALAANLTAGALPAAFDVVSIQNR
jgi:preprotein translocase subunit SecD